ncbi:threonine synthase-like 2 [Palaemon carinicauda]|uniref:threonine synthase-like 2 n=1 Tax=Palaemon carinicauda TaxID=392227 RepID=UPI0035B6948B
MKYCSTRGQEKNLTFEEVLFSGYAKDGGLYMPEFLPNLSHKEMEQWSKYSYPDLVFAVARKFIDEEEIPSSVLNDIITSCLKRFRIPEVVRIEKLVGGLNIVELFHGTTLAFKDLALSVVGGLIDHYLSKKKKHITILIGTSGDTGSAAIEGVRGRKGIDIVVLLPSGRCTMIQELQMTTVIEDNVLVYKVEGTSDDLDEPIKQCFCDQEFVSKHNLISINSINWGRIMVQVAHYFFTYYQLCSELGAPVQIVVPTGAAGNITAGCIAKKMGLPITLVATVNENDIISRTIDKGDFSMNSFVTQTMASAMDIQNPYNVERLIYLCCEGNVERVRKIMGAFESNGKVTIPVDILQALQEIVVDSIIVNDSEITTTMEKVYNENKYVLCPHTATAVYYHHQRNSDVTRGFIATASPAKFPEAVIKAGIDPITDGVDHLQYLPTKFLWMRKGEDWYSMLRAKIENITELRNRKV